MPSYRKIDHTGDMGFECEASTLEELFGAALLSLSDIIATLDSLDASETRDVRAKGEDDAARLHGLLEEALFQFEKDGFLAREARVSFGRDGSVAAALRGQRVDPDVRQVDRVVKAITWHGLEVAKKRGKLRARVILDL